MFKLAVFSCDQQPLPGQQAKLIFQGKTVFCPIYSYKEDYIWCFVPHVVGKADLVDIVGLSLKGPAKSGLSLMKREYYFDIFYWTSFWRNKIVDPIIIELPQRLSFGKVIPSKFMDNRYPWFSQYFAAIEEIEAMGVAHRVVDSAHPYALPSIEIISSMTALEQIEPQEV